MLKLSNLKGGDLNKIEQALNLLKNLKINDGNNELSLKSFNNSNSSMTFVNQKGGEIITNTILLKIFYVKVYCGPKKEIPKTYDRAGTMLECAEKRGGIALWGVNKVDSKILRMVNGENDENKKTEDLIKEIKLKQTGLQGKLTKLRKEHNSAKDDKIKENIKKEFEKIKNEINKLQETVDTLKKNL